MDNKNIKIILIIFILMLITFIAIKIYITTNNIEINNLEFTKTTYPKEYVSDDENTFFIKLKKPSQINIVDDFIDILDNKDVLDRVAILKIKEYFSEFDYEDKYIRYIPPSLNDKADKNSKSDSNLYGVFEYIYNEDELHKEVFSEKDWKFYRMIDDGQVYIFLYNEVLDKQKAIVNYILAEDEFNQDFKIYFINNDEIKLNPIIESKNISYIKDYNIFEYMGKTKIDDKIKNGMINSNDILNYLKKDWSYKENKFKKDKDFGIYNYSNFKVYVDDKNIIFMPSDSNLYNVKKELEQFILDKQNAIKDNIDDSSDNINNGDNENKNSFNISINDNSNNINNNANTNINNINDSDNDNDSINTNGNNRNNDFENNDIEQPIITFIPQR